MSILSIKREALLPDRELVINKNLVLRQNPALIAAITEQENVIKLWIFQQIPDSPLTDMDCGPIECETNRDEILRRCSYTCVSPAHISDIAIQGISLPISRSQSGLVGRDPLKYMKLQHFMEAGVDFSSIENICFDELTLSEYQMTEDAVFPDIDTSSGMPVSLSIMEDSREALIEPPHLFNLKIGGQDIARSFYDPSDGKEIEYYIGSLVCYDIWKETEERFRDEKTLEAWREQGLDDAAIEKMRQSLPESIGRICPKGHELLLLQYECSVNAQLNFYTSDFLLEKPDHAGGCAALIGSVASEDSRHGHQVRSCLLKAVPAGFDAIVDVELVSWHKIVPDEKVSLP